MADENLQEIVRKEVETVMRKENKKKVQSDRGVVVKNPMPYDPENIKLSKEEFVAKETARKEKELKIKEFAATLDESKEEVKTEVKVETPQVTKPRGRPKKIE